MSRRLGSTGLQLSALTLGTWGLCAESYGRVFVEQQRATLARALELGITSFDMAPTWGEDGAAERAVAQAVGDRRDQLTYITRIGRVDARGSARERNDVAGEGGLAPAFGADELRAGCEASLRRLATDRIDLLLLQHPNSDEFRRDELPATMAALVSEGKIRAWGASVSHVDDARAALVSGAQALCLPFSMLQPEQVWDLASECRERGVGILARSVLLHGLLSGHWTDKKRFTADDHRFYRWSSEALGARLRQAREFQQRLQAAPNLTTLALQFVLAHEDVTTGILGARTPAQVSAAVEALNSELQLAVSDLQFHYNHLR